MAKKVIAVGLKVGGKRRSGWVRAVKNPPERVGCYSVSGFISGVEYPFKSKVN